MHPIADSLSSIKAMISRLGHLCKSPHRIFGCSPWSPSNKSKDTSVRLSRAGKSTLDRPASAKAAPPAQTTATVNAFCGHPSASNRSIYTTLPQCKSMFHICLVDHDEQTCSLNCAPNGTQGQSTCTWSGLSLNRNGYTWACSFGSQMQMPDIYTACTDMGT